MCPFSSLAFLHPTTVDKEPLILSSKQKHPYTKLVSSTIQVHKYRDVKLLHIKK